MREEKVFTVYIVTNTRRGVLYTGMTSDLIGRAWKHRDGVLSGFSRQWGLKRLVWYETMPDAESAIALEKRIKRWRRDWKFALVEKMNPDWDDLGPGLLGDVSASGGPG